MPKRRPFGLPKRQKKKESTNKTNVSLEPIEAAMIAVGIKKTDTDSSNDFNSGLDEMVGLVAVAAAVLEAPTEGGATMMTGGLISAALNTYQVKGRMQLLCQ